MRAKLKNRVNKLYGKNIWQGLSKHDKDMLRSIGAYKVWQLCVYGAGEYKMIDNVIAWAESAKTFKEIDEDNLKIAHEFEPIAFESLEKLYEDELEITPSGVILLKELFNENETSSKQSV